MDWLRHDLLTLLILIPSIGAVGVLFAGSPKAIRWTALISSLVTLAASLLIFIPFDWHSGGIYGYSEEGGVVQMVTRADWIESLHVQYLVGVDGLSLGLVLLTTFITALAVIASWKTEKMAKGYFALLLFLESGMLGVFLALDFFLFYVFFELSLVPMYFLIGIWGGPKREYAAIKFFLFTLIGSVAILIALIGTYLYSKQIDPNGSFDLIHLASPQFQQQLIAAMPPGIARTFFVLLMFGFLIKVPAVPLHTWLPDAHVEAPTAVSMILAAILLKMGGYGILRVAYPLFPDAAKVLWLLPASLGVISIIYGAFCALAQTDFKRLVAYSSVSHMGFVVLGAAMMTTASINGAMFMMIAHGITSAALFFIVGVIYDRAHHRELSRFGGIANAMPVYFGLSSVAFLASLGLPGLCGFVGEILVLLGTFAAGRKGEILYNWASQTGHLDSLIFWSRTFAVIASVGIVLTAAYMLWTIQRIFFGQQRPQSHHFPEISRREITVLAPLTAMAVLLGIVPTFLYFMFTSQTVSAILQAFK
jgi:NADH-quinone oxidoreductase subunit M